VARDAAAHEQQALLRVDAHHLDVQRGDALVAHVPGMRRPLITRPGNEPGPIDPPWRKYSWAPWVARREAVPLHHARVALALRGADHVDALARAEDVDADLLADLVLLELLGADPALAQLLRRRTDAFAQCPWSALVAWRGARSP
jgi:hypothetical protein